MIKLCEKLYFGARTIEHKTEDLVSINCCEYLDPKANNKLRFIGYDYPTVKKQGSIVVCLKNGTTEVYPASNWQIEF